MASSNSSRKSHFLSSPFRYQRHQPEKTTLYKLIQENLLSFYQQIDHDQEKGLPDFIKKEFEEFLKCGLLSHGFLRLQCESCQQEKLIAFSCKRRGFCPSCGAKRMAENTAHLLDEVFPHKPLRQWVLSFPFPLSVKLSYSTTKGSSDKISWSICSSLQIPLFDSSQISF